MLGVYTIVGASALGRGAAQTLGLGLVAASLLGAFVVRQARAPQPLIPLRIFRSRIVSSANLVQALMFGGMFGMFFPGALYLQRVLGYDALQVGLAFLPVAVSVGALSVGLSARLILRFGAALSVRIGLSAGEPVTDAGDLFGAAVQLAARLCAHAEPGGILTSTAVRDLSIGKGFVFIDQGEVALRGFEEPVRPYAVQWNLDPPGA